MAFVALRGSEIRGRRAGNGGPDNLRAEFAILVRSDWTGSRLDAQPSNRSLIESTAAMILRCLW